MWGGRWNSVQNTCFSVSDIIICVWQCQRQLNQYKCFIWSDQLKHKHHNTNVPIPYLMIRSSSEFCSDEKLSLKIRWWKTNTNFFSALMRLYFIFKGKSLIKCLSFEILREYQTHFLFWINWFWNIFVYTVVKVFTSIYLKYWKEHLNIFYLFYISSALKNNAVRSFFYVFMCSLYGIQFLTEDTCFHSFDVF